jgi:sec-independent protein translocase protein TatA
MPLGTTEITIIIAVIVLLFGATMIPKIARSLGSAQGEFKKARKAFDEAKLEVVETTTLDTTSKRPSVAANNKAEEKEPQCCDHC